MIESLRAKLASLGVPQDDIASFEKAIRADEASRWKVKLVRAEDRVMDVSDDCSAWRLKYLRAFDALQLSQQQLILKDKKIADCLKSIGKLSGYVKDLRRELFGSTSERLPTTKPPAPAANTSSERKKRGKKRGSKGHGRSKDENLDEVPVPHDLSDEDKRCVCGDSYELTDLPPVTSNETHLEQRAFVRAHHRRKAIRRCHSCGRKPGIATAKKPDKIISKSKYSTELWRYIIEEKFWLQRPINRVITRLKSLGINARASTINNGLRQLHASRIYEAMYESIVDRGKLAELRHMDETGWKVFVEIANKESSNWFMWVSRTSDTTVFILDPSKSNEVIGAHLDGAAEGIIVCDRASSFKCFARKNKGFIIAFCWIHQRRDFIKLKNAYSQHTAWADDWLTRIDALILQNKLRTASVSNSKEFKAEDKALRKMIRKMERRIEEQLADKSLPEECSGRVKSLQEHWSGLTVFVNFPQVPMSNNEAERALREAVIGRKVYYGSRAIWSGQLTSWLFTIYATLEQNGIDPVGWMNEYLHACAANDGCALPTKQHEQFLPWNYKKRISPSPDALSDPILEQHRLTVTVLEENTHAASL